MTKKPTKSQKPEVKRKRRQKHADADWGNADAGLLAQVIVAVTGDGRAIRLGYSRDGGAYAIGVYGDGEPFTEYLPGTLEVDDWLEELKLDYE